ncbi:MAG: AIM24 family protein [Frankiales bacterium]|nr:AIM24 family protein [Frankiales bacterium]
MLSHQVVGNAMQMAVVSLEPGQTVYCEAGKFLWKTTNISVETRLTKPQGNQQGAPASASGFMKKALDVGKRVLAGESLAFQYYRADGSAGTIAFAGVLPGELRALELDGSRSWYAEKDAFVAAESSVDFDIAFSGLRTGIKGGEGFVLEKFTGKGTVFVAGAGNFIELNPAKYGGKLQIDTGCIVAFEDTVKYSVERVGALNAQTAMTAIFGGEGLSLATLEGDGQVILQSMTIEGLAKALRKNMGIGDDKKGPLGGLLSGSLE